MLYVILDHLGVPVDRVPQDVMDNYYRKMEALFYEYHPVLIDPETVAYAGKAERKRLHHQYSE